MDVLTSLPLELMHAHQMSWAVLDAAELKLFPSEEDSGQVKNLTAAVRISQLAKVELVDAST